MLEFVFGNGNMIVASLLSKEGKHGVLIKEAEKPNPIDSIVPGYTNTEYVPEERDVVLWFDNLQSARVLQDRINILCLKLNNYEVVDLQNES